MRTKSTTPAPSGSKLLARARLLLPLAAVCLLVPACGASANSATGPRTSAVGSSSTGTSSTVASATGTSAAKPTSKPLSGHATVSIRDFAYHPDHLIVTPGTKITFHNYDQTAHTATALDGAFATGTIEPGHSATIVVHKPGFYRYHCLFHAFMVGSITVVRAH